MESDEDYENQISIRSTVVDFIDEANQHMEFDKAILEKVIGMFVTDNFGEATKLSN